MQNRTITSFLIQDKHYALTLPLNNLWIIVTSNCSISSFFFHFIYISVWFDISSFLWLFRENTQQSKNKMISLLIFLLNEITIDFISHTHICIKTFHINPSIFNQNVITNNNKGKVFMKWRKKVTTNKQTNTKKLYFQSHLHIRLWIAYAQEAKEWVLKFCCFGCCSYYCC